MSDKAYVSTRQVPPVLEAISGRDVVLVASRHGNRVELLGASILEWLAYGLAVFLILFPKGGFKAGSIPLTWGYGLIGIAIILGLPFWLIRNSSKIRRGSFGALLCLAPLQLLFLFCSPTNLSRQGDVLALDQASWCDTSDDLRHLRLELLNTDATFFCA